MLKGLTPHKRGRKSKRNPQDDEIQKLRRENQRLTELRTGQEARIILPSFRPPFALDSIDDVTKILLRQVEEVFISQ